jgi:2',3'-cyclic-nucleotide 2'-phosphodiesterase (5'-nucleotidase family)
VDLKLGKNLNLSGLSKYKVFEKGRIKIAVLSVFHPKSSSNVLKGVYIKDPIFSLLKDKESIEKDEVHLKILLASIKSGCHSESPMDKKSFNDFENFQLTCPANDELFKFISRLPPNFIDLIILNNDHFADGFIGELPIIQNPGKGKYFSRIKITYDLSSKKIIKDKSEILPPLKTCHFFFASTEDCHLGPENLSIKEKKRIDWILESGNKIVPAIYLGEKLKNWSDSITN